MRHHFKFRRQREDADDTSMLVSRACFHGPYLWQKQVKPEAEWGTVWKCGRCGHINDQETDNCDYCQTVKTDD